MIAHDLHFGPELKGVLLSAFFWSYALMQVPIGWAVDRFNLRRLYGGMFLLWSLSQGLTGLAVGLGTLIVFRVLLGIGESVYLPAGSKIVSRLFAPDDRGFPTGLFNCGTGAGLAVGAPLTALLIGRYGWRHMFLIVGAVALAWLVPWLAAFPLRLPSVDPERRAQVGKPSGAMKRVLGFDRDLLGISLGAFSFGYYLYVMVTWLPDYLMTVWHLALRTAGFYTALPFLIFALSQPLGGWIADRLIRLGWNAAIARKTVITLSFLCGLLLIPAMYVQSPIRAIWLIAGSTFAACSVPNYFVFAQCCAPEDGIGVWTGVTNFAANVAGVLAPLATGFLIARAGSYSWGFTLSALILVAGILPFWFIVGELKPRQPANTPRV